MVANFLEVLTRSAETSSSDGAAEDDHSHEEAEESDLAMAESSLDLPSSPRPHPPIQHLALIRNPNFPTSERDRVERI
ncbi:hypothetical protein Scep_030692 [Stephania cephalantha]|uniref:Uncharacterized protein n=1 Tax=Stephania cephalantha TaxID=152367 RepID=A0AAP0E092_9MAGN